MALPQISIDLIEASNVLGPLALVIVSIAVYGIFVFHFYRFVARKDMFSLNLQKHNQARRPFLRKTIFGGLLHIQVSAALPDLRVHLVRG